MNKTKLLLASLLSVFLLTGCGLTSNMTQNLNLNQTSVVLSQANFHVVKTVNASVSARYVFGLGGLGKKALENNAVADLTKEAGLTGSQALVNVTVKSSTKTILFLSQVTFYAEGTVIEFDK